MVERHGETTGPPSREESRWARVDEAGGDETLRREIGALRVVLADLLAECEEAPDRLALRLPPLVNAIVRALHAQRELAGGDARAVALLNEALARLDERQ